MGFEGNFSSGGGGEEGGGGGGSPGSFLVTKDVVDADPTEQTQRFVCHVTAETEVAECFVISDTLITANNDDYATFEFVAYSAAGASLGTVALQTTKTIGGGGTGDLAANVKVVIAAGAFTTLPANTTVRATAYKDGGVGVGLFGLAFGLTPVTA